MPEPNNISISDGTAPKVASQWRHAMKTRYIVGIGLACVLAAGFLVVRHLLNNPRDAFERLVIKPIPNSVHLARQAEFAAMDSTLVVLQFQISKEDLQMLLNIQHFNPIDESKEFKRWDQSSKDYIQIQKEEFLSLWKRRIRNAAKLDVDFTNTWQVYTLKEGHGEKYIFSEQDGADVVFVAEAH